MAVNTVAFSAVNALLFKPRAGWNVEGAGRIDVSGVGSSEEGLALPEYEHLAAATTAALIPAAQGRVALAWQQPGATETVWALVVSTTYFDILEQTALTGRLFPSSDADPAAVVSERFWREHLGATNLAGRTLTLNGVETPVIGVVPDAHDGPGGLYEPQVWIPLEARRLFGLTGKYDDQQMLWLSMLGRPAPGASVQTWRSSGSPSRSRHSQGVLAVGVADRIPFYIGFQRETDVATNDLSCMSGGCPRVAMYSVRPGFFHALDVPILRGRDLTGADADGLIVNQAFAETYFAGTSGVGEVVRIGPHGEPRVVIGIVRTTLQRGFSEQPTPVLYLPMVQSQLAEPLTIVARTSSDPASLVRAATDSLYRVEPTMAAESVMTMSGRLELLRWPLRSVSVFFGTCGVLALLLATIGLAAVMTHAVGQRMREFGVRLAIGANSRHLLRDVCSSGLRIAGFGTVGGMAFGLSRLPRR